MVFEVQRFLYKERIIFVLQVSGTGKSRKVLRFLIFLIGCGIGIVIFPRIQERSILNSNFIGGGTNILFGLTPIGCGFNPTKGEVKRGFWILNG